MLLCGSLTSAGEWISLRSRVECAAISAASLPEWPVRSRYSRICWLRGLDASRYSWVYGIVSDGDLMEGVASEAASLAGALRLGKLIYLYDNNHISIEGKTDHVFTENVQRRFEAYGWQVLTVEDGTDLDAIESAIQAARAENARPSLIAVRNHIGYGSPKQDTAAAHGEPLGTEDVKATKEKLGWPLEPTFFIPEQAGAHFLEAVATGKQLEREWDMPLKLYTQEYPDLSRQDDNVMRGELPRGWDSDRPSFRPGDGPMATRDASGKVMNTLARRLPQLMGGSADLAPSTKTILMGYGDFGFGEDCGRNLHFGVREQAMGAIANGLAVHGGILPYTATFLTFSDYMRPPIRLAALMQTHVVFIFTHDSIGLGEDGPTHQPVEQLLAAGHSPTRRDSACRCERDCGSVAHLTQSSRADGDGFESAEAADSRPGALPGSGGSGKWRLRSLRSARREGCCHSDCDRVRGSSRAGSPNRIAAERRAGARGLDALLGTVRRANGRLPGESTPSRDSKACH